MNRRGFFKMMAAGVLVASTMRLSSVAALVGEPEPAVVFDTVNRVIKVGSDMTLNELYSEVIDAFDDFEMMQEPVPLLALTPERLQMENGWDISESSRRFLHNGTIIPCDRIYHRSFSEFFA